LLFNDFFSLRAHSFARALCGGGVHSLPRGKERTKKTDFGKPKSQVCLFAGANIAQARAQTLRAKGPNALWIPATRKRRCVVTPLMFARRFTSSAFALAF